MRLGRIGFDHIAGYVTGGMGALDGRPNLLARIERITAPTLAELLSGGSPPVVLDVRTPGEWRQERIADARHIPLNHLRERVGEVSRAGVKVVTHCASGYRSSVAASLLRQHGVSDVADLVGGIAAWKASHLPTLTAAPA